MNELDIGQVDSPAAAYQKGSPTEFNPFQILGVSPEATSLDIRAAYLKLKATFSESNESIYSLISVKEIGLNQRLIDRAYDAIRDEESRKAYTDSLYPEQKSVQEPASVQQPETQSSSGTLDGLAWQRNRANSDKTAASSQNQHTTSAQVQANRSLRQSGSLKVRADAVDSPKLKDELLSIIENAEHFTGEVVKNLRVAAGLSQKEVEYNTKVSAKIISAIEQDLYHELPAAIYVRGFLKSFFKFLALGQQTAFIDGYTERQKSAVDNL